MHYSQLFKLFLLGLFLVEFTACGYKPSAKYAREVLGKKISTSVIITATDPENSVIIKDAVDEAIIEVFHASLVERRYSNTHLSLTINNPTYTPVQYNSNGYIISYRAIINLIITRESQKIKKTYKTSGAYDFSVVPNSVLTDQERFDAIKFSSLKAISAFVAQVSAEGAQKN